MTDVRQQVVTVFAEEAREMVQGAARQIIKLEKRVDEEARRDLLRVLHNLKGTAAILGFDGASRLAHLLETLIEASPEGRPLGARTSDLALEALDAVAEHVKAIADGAPQEASDASLDAMLAKLEAMLAEAGLTAPPAPRVARPDELQVPVSTGASRAPVAAPSVAHPVSEEAAVSVRVPAERLERVLEGAEELHGLRARLLARVEQTTHLVRSIEGALRATPVSLSKDLHRALRALRQEALELNGASLADAQVSGSLVRELGENIRALRTTPASALLDSVERATRDHARTVGKQVTVRIEGRAVELDRLLLDELRAPLVHLVRNAVDHGLEAPDERLAAGKAAEGTLSVRLSANGELLKVVVEDDGRGIVLDRVRARAVERGLLAAEDAERATETQLLEFLFSAGFSTAKELSQTSGRGVGLDAVRDMARRLRGNARLDHQPGQGTRFTIEVPLTVASIHALLVRVGQQQYALPTQAVKSIAVLRADEVRVVRGHAWVADGAALVPLDRLGASLGMALTEGPYRSHVRVVKLVAGAKVAGFVVTDYHDEIELIVKPLPAELRELRHLAGVASLGTGETILVLAPDFLVEKATGRTGLPDPTAEKGRHRVLVVDDSTTTRLLHQSALEAAGFEVLLASDGDEALQLLETTAVDAVVSDVRMPRMTGLELTRAVRGNPRLKHLPFLLCSTEDEHAAATAAGADGVLLKQDWEKGVLASMVRGLLERKPS